MLGRALNELTVHLAWHPHSPLLIKAGEPPVDPQDHERALQDKAFDTMVDYEGAAQERERHARQEQKAANRQARQEARHSSASFEETPDMRFVRTRRNGRQEPYLPGSSLKGVIRSWSERLARTMGGDGRGACDLFASPCAGRWSETDRPPGPEAYKQVCPICRTFGHLYLAGRLSLSDAYLASQETVDELTRRDGVGIDRLKGAAAEGAKYLYEVWDGGTFYGSLRLRNFELWQVGLLAHVLSSLDEGEIRFGYGTRRGLGRLQGEVTQLEVTYLGGAALRAARASVDGAMPLLGLYHLDRERVGDYGYESLPAEPPQVVGATRTEDGLRQIWSLAPEAQDALWDCTGPVWNAYMDRCRAAGVNDNE